MNFFTPIPCHMADPEHEKLVSMGLAEDIEDPAEWRVADLHLDLAMIGCVYTHGPYNLCHFWADGTSYTTPMEERELLRLVNKAKEERLRFANNLKP
jgi:hypothetical protein